MALLIISVVSAENCYTAISVPSADKLYWKAITYDGVKDSSYNDYLTRNDDPTDLLSIGPGNAYTIRLESNCFGGYLLNNKESTGITSSQINIQKRNADYYTTNYLSNKIYTLSVQQNNDVSTKRVNEINTGVIEGTDYLALPDSFSVTTKHLEFQTMMTGVCNPNLKITEQLEQVKEAIWKTIDGSTTASGCSQTNIIDCVITSKTGTNKEYATLFMIAARTCGVPSRVVTGISEANFDGVDLYFPKDKTHYWIEYYDGKWFEKEVTETSTSIPSSLENNCQDGIDNNQNGLVDCWDSECSESYACTSWVTTNVFDNDYSTDLTTLPNPYSVNNLTIGNEYGSVTWTDQELDLRGVQIETAVNIAPNLISINEQVPSLDSPATAKLLGLTPGTKKILKNNALCTECKIIEELPASIEFNITGKGTYKIQYNNINTTNTTTTIVPVANTAMGTGLWNKVKTSYNKLTNLSKIIIVIIIIGLFWLYKKSKRRSNYGRYR